MTIVKHEITRKHFHKTSGKCKNQQLTRNQKILKNEIYAK